MLLNAKSYRFFAPSKLVKSLRLLFPFLFLFLLGVILIWPYASKIIKLKSASTPLVDAQIAAEVIKDNRLNNANFRDVDDAGRPFSITAEQAQQHKTIANALDLNTPKAELMVSEQETVYLTADQGLYRRADKILILSGDVVVTRAVDTDNTVLRTSRLQVDVKGNSAHTDQPVTLTNKASRITGTGMLIQDNGAVVIFTGPVTARFLEDTP